MKLGLALKKHLRGRSITTFVNKMRRVDGPNMPTVVQVQGEKCPRNLGKVGGQKGQKYVQLVI